MFFDVSFLKNVVYGLSLCKKLSVVPATENSLKKRISTDDVDEDNDK